MEKVGTCIKCLSDFDIEGRILTLIFIYLEHFLLIILRFLLCFFKFDYKFYIFVSMFIYRGIFLSNMMIILLLECFILNMANLLLCCYILFNLSYEKYMFTKGKMTNPLVVIRIGV